MGGERSRVLWEQLLGPPFLWAQGVGRCQGSGDVIFFGGRGGCFMPFIVFRFERTPSSLCHNHDLPANTPQRAKKNKSIVGFGAELQLKFSGPRLSLSTKPHELCDASHPRGKPLF